MKMKTAGVLFFTVSLVCSAALAAGLLYFQGVLGLYPCPMCAAQRAAYMAGALFFATGGMFSLVGRGVSAAVAGIAGSAALAGGAVVAARQAWLTRYPDSFGCDVSPEEKLLYMSRLPDLWPAMFEASGPCSEVKWSLMGLGMADWSLALFAACLAAGAAGVVAALGGRRNPGAKGSGM